MKQIVIYSDGSKALIDTEHKTQLKISGKEVIETIEATDENMQEHFPQE